MAAFCISTINKNSPVKCYNTGMAKTLLGTIVDNTNTINGMQKRRNSSIVTIVGQEHNDLNGVIYFAISPDLSIVSELKFKFVTTSSFSNVVLDGGLSLGWSGGSGVSPNSDYNGFFDLLASISGTSYASSLFNGGVHTLSFSGGGSIKALMYAKYSARNR